MRLVAVGLLLIEEPGGDHAADQGAGLDPARRTKHRCRHADPRAGMAAAVAVRDQCSS